MKKMFLIMLLLCVSHGCQDVIEVDVPIDEPRLVVDALIRLDDIESPSVSVQIRATITTSFFSDVQPAILDEIFLTNLQTGNMETLEASSDAGVYQKDVPTEMLIQGVVQLSISANGEEYTAVTEFVPSVPFNSLTQGTSTLFSNDETEVIISFTDAPDRVDFYLFDFNFDEYLVSEDTFYPGQPFQFSYFYEPGLKPDTQLEIGILGVDEPFYNYMTQLIVQSGGDQGPFQSPAATVKGNIVNITNPDHFALGYFAISEIFTSTLIIEER